jgi:hypothetical protein
VTGRLWAPQHAGLSRCCPQAAIAASRRCLCRSSTHHRICTSWLAYRPVHAVPSRSLLSCAAVWFLSQGYDVLAKAKTGTGKTLAFLIPIAEHLVASATPVSPNKARQRVGLCTGAAGRSGARGSDALLFVGAASVLKAPANSSSICSTVLVYRMGKVLLASMQDSDCDCDSVSLLWLVVLCSPWVERSGRWCWPPRVS